MCYSDTVTLVQPTSRLQVGTRREKEACQQLKQASDTTTRPEDKLRQTADTETQLQTQLEKTKLDTKYPNSKTCGLSMHCKTV